MQIDDLNAINNFFKTAGAQTPQALDISLAWHPWFNNLSWFEKNTDSAILKDANNRRNAFNAANKPGSKTVVTPKGQPKVVAAPTKLTIKQGSTGQNVMEWQRIIEALPIDGVFGPNTTMLTKSWQQKNGLPVDGIVGPATWKKALEGNNVYAAVAADVNTQAVAAQAVKPAGAKVPVGTPIAATSSSTLRRGSQGQAVSDWQKKIGFTPMSGYFDEATERATKDWQAKHGLNGDGIVGPATKAASMVVPTPVKLVTPLSQVAAAGTKIKETVKETIKATPKKVTETISAVVPQQIKSKPIWMKIAGAFAIGGLAIAGVQHVRKKP